MKPFNIEEYLANPNRKVITRSGKSVKIYCTNYQYQYPIIAQVEGEDISRSFGENGRFTHSESGYDLFFAPKKNEGWINIFKTYDRNFLGQSTIYESEKTAIEEGKNYSNYFTTIKIEWEE